MTLILKNVHTNNERNTNWEWKNVLKNVHTNNERNTNWEWKNVLNKKACFTLSDISHSRILYDPPPRILEIKAKINKWDLMKLCTTKEAISKVKRQPSDWEKIIANEATDKGLI